MQVSFLTPEERQMFRQLFYTEKTLKTALKLGH